MSIYTIRNILVPVDLSETSLNALDTAVALALKHAADIYILNVIEPFYDTTFDSTFSFLSSLGNSADVLQALTGAIQHKSEIKPKILQEEGNVADCIIKQSLSLGADLLVMGTHGASGYRDGFIGNNSYAVLKHVKCPVLTVPPRRKYLSFKKILFPIRPVLGALARFDVVSQVLNPGASMDILGLSYRGVERETNVLDKLIDDVREPLALNKIKTKPAWGAGISVADDVLQYTQQTTPDLLVITSGLDAIAKPSYIGPYAQRIISAAKVPVLSIKKIVIPSIA